MFFIEYKIILLLNSNLLYFIFYKLSSCYDKEYGCSPVSMFKLLKELLTSSNFLKKKKLLNLIL